ncbi:unnamed protein product, partial [marine sediment metagenome]
MKKILWAEMTMEEIESVDKEYTVVLFPVGSVEGHGPHLPVKCDSHNVTELCKRVALEAGKQEINVMVVPTLMFGYSEWMAYPGKLSLDADTFMTVVRKVCESIIDNDFKKIIIVNGHGGNPSCLYVAAQQLYNKHKIIIPVMDWFKVVADSVGDIIQTTMWHADEGETSVSLALDMNVEMSKAGKETPRSPLKSFDQTNLGLSQVQYCIPFTTITERSVTGIMGDAT